LSCPSWSPDTTNAGLGLLRQAQHKYADLADEHGFF
jgi:hypothetical protein